MNEVTTDQTLVGIVDRLQAQLDAIGAKRRRGGIARGVGWLEVAGRAPDGAWMELRLHHRPSELRLQAGLLAYQPLTKGGRTIVVGEASVHYDGEIGSDVEQLIETIETWLERVTTGQWETPIPR